MGHLAEVPALAVDVDLLAVDPVGRERQGVENAQRKVRSGQPRPAESMIQAFIQQVQDLAADGILTAEQAAALISDARAAIGDIESLDVA